MIEFDGPGLSDDDHVRLGTQLEVVRSIMADGRWRTMATIQQIMRQRGIEASLPSISARLRDLRKNKFGGYIVEKELSAPGLYLYRVAAAVAA